MVVMFLCVLILSFIKIVSSNNVMSVLTSMELFMSSIFMIMVFLSPMLEYSYILIVFLCLVVCESTVGLSLVIGLFKLQSEVFCIKNSYVTKI